MFNPGGRVNNKDEKGTFLVLLTHLLTLFYLELNCSDASKLLPTSAPSWSQFRCQERIGQFINKLFMLFFRGMRSDGGVCLGMKGLLVSADALGFHKEWNPWGSPG